MFLSAVSGAAYISQTLSYSCRHCVYVTFLKSRHQVGANVKNTGQIGPDDLYTYSESLSTHGSILMKRSSIQCMQ